MCVRIERSAEETDKLGHPAGRRCRRLLCMHSHRMQCENIPPNWCNDHAQAGMQRLLLRELSPQAWQVDLFLALAGVEVSAEG